MFRYYSTWDIRNRYIKKLLKINPEAKAIITSGHVTCKDQQKMFSNAAAYIEKPYQIMILKETLNHILR